ncbi:hypothetical protein D8Y20_10450 [Mariprofundus sp. EBB-1]|nr:hypothetical protein D8Y20_10450 [Mariprofundus sp. EBB-1]
MRFFTSHRNHILTISIFMLFNLLACSDYDKQAINALLDARDIAVSTHNIRGYDALLLPDYHDKSGQSEFDIVSKMNKLFAQFEETEMTSSNRVIRMLDEHSAECEQSYLLRVKADGTWRQLNQRERITLSKTSDGWKISGGL